MVYINECIDVNTALKNIPSNLWVVWVGSIIFQEISYAGKPQVVSRYFKSMLVGEKISCQIQIFPQQADGIFKTTKTNKHKHTHTQTQTHTHTSTHAHEHTHKHALTNTFAWTHNFCGHNKHKKLNNIH
jgi:hypothetical protein